MTYLVFARAAYAEPLSFQGTLEVLAGELPNQRALDAYGDDWVELILLPESEAHWAILEQPSHAVEAQP